MLSAIAHPPRWLFVDMDGFFAAAEKHLRPELRDRPVGVIPVDSRGSCVIAASHDAKKCGIRVGTRVPEAEQLCPGIQLVKARPDTYVRLHHDVAKSIDRWLPIHRAYSIDEWAIQLRGPDQHPERALELARSIKRQIYADFSPWLSCSIGIAPTRLLAKIASDLDKPDGITTLTPDDLPERLEHRPLHKLVGIARPMEERLHNQGVRTVRDLWNLTRRQAVQAWGSVQGGYWWAGFHGVDEPEMPTRQHSMSHANVLEPRLRSDEGARSMLIRLITRLGIRLRDAELVANRLSVHVYYGDSDGRFGADIELPRVQDTPSLLNAFYTLWERRRPTPATPMRVGATVSGLALLSQTTGCLFNGTARDDRLSKTLDQITGRWGPAAAYFGSMHDCTHEMEDKIAFGRIPPVLRRQVK